MHKIDYQNLDKDRNIMPIKLQSGTIVRVQKI